MSRRIAGDYKAVLKFIKGDVFNKKFELHEVVGDFEKAVWRAVQDVLPGVTIKGCGFHWSQCLLRKIKNIGMTKLYKEHVGVRAICKKLMSLNLIPWQKVLSCWKELVQQGKDLKLKRCDAGKLVKSLKYVKCYWIENNQWPPSNWSVFMQEIRANNDTEGWHTRLHKLAGLLNQIGMNMYSLIQLMSRLTPVSPTTWCTTSTTPTDLEAISTKKKHLLRARDLHLQNKMNYDAVARLCRPEVREDLTLHVPGSESTCFYLKLMDYIPSRFIEKNLLPLERLPDLVCGF